MMQTSTTEASLADELLENEEVLWSGQPNLRGRGIGSSPFKVFLNLGLIFLLIGLLLIGVGLILRLSSVVPPNLVNSLFGLFVPGGVFSLLGLIYLILGLTLSSFAPTQTLYAITNRRVIILRSGKNRRLVSSYNKRAITQVHRIERPNGEGNLILAVHPRMYGNGYDNSSSYSYYGIGRRAAFNQIPNVRQVEQKLLRMLDQS